MLLTRTAPYSDYWSLRQLPLFPQFRYNSHEDNLGVAIIRQTWDPVERIETETYHDLSGNLVEILYGFCEVHYHLDEQMQLCSACCYNREGEIVEEQGTEFA